MNGREMLEAALENATPIRMCCELRNVSKKRPSQRQTFGCDPLDELLDNLARPTILVEHVDQACFY